MMIFKFIRPFNVNGIRSFSDSSSYSREGDIIIDSVSYNTIDDRFKTPVTKRRGSNLRTKNRYSIIINVRDLYDLDLFRNILLNKVSSSNIYYIKVFFEKDIHKMAGAQSAFLYKDYSSYEVLWQLVTSKVDAVCKTYEHTRKSINHIVLNIRPVNDNFVSKFRISCQTEDGKSISYLNEPIFSKSIIPVSVDKNFLGTALFKSIDDGYIADVKYLNTTVLNSSGNYNLIHLRDVFYTDPKLSCLSKNFEFYFVKINSKQYILGIHYLSNNMIRKIRLDPFGHLIEDVTDTFLDDDYVKRVSGNNVDIIKGNTIVKSYVDKKLTSLKALETKSSASENPNIGVIDLETFQYKDGTYKVYSAGFLTYLDKECSLYYVEDGESSDLLILKLINELLRSKYSKTTFYCHNLGGYDIIFLLKVLVDYNSKNEEKYDLKFHFKESRILSISISKNNSKLVIKDSYAIFDSSLRDLCKAFDCVHKKSYFPYKFGTYDNLFYEGVTPNIGYYNDIRIEDYNKLISDNWSFELETLKYLKSDLNSLYEVLSKANKSLFLNYDIDMTNSLTISGIAIKVFLSQYYDHNIPLITQKSMYDDIKKSYYGGITEVYKPTGRNLYYYDINSLYPYAALNDMPGLSFKNILFSSKENIEKLFGFFYCTIDATDVKEKYLGVLPLRGDGLIYPLGKWDGWYFSEELKFAKSLGYKIDVIKGYEFTRSKNVFTKYVQSIYANKMNASNIVKRNIAKSLLNNLLGRFGIDLNKYETNLMSNEDFDHMLHVRNVRGHHTIGNMNLVSYSTSLNYELIEELGMDVNKVAKIHSNSEIKYQSSSSVVISAAVTAYARVIMTKHKLEILNRGGNIYYSDTDSIVTDLELPEELVSSNELGKFKLEYKVKEGIFISGKTYCLVLENGKVIKRAKGVKADSLHYNDYLLLLNKVSVEAHKRFSVKDYGTGSVEIVDDQKVLLNSESYVKRDKVINGSRWVDTKPVFINTKDLSLIPYRKPIINNGGLTPDVINTYPSYKENKAINNDRSLFSLTKYSIFYNNILLYPLFSFLIILYVLSKAIVLDDNQDDYIYNNYTFDDNIKENTTTNNYYNNISDIKSISDTNRTYYSNNNSFIEKYIYSKESYKGDSNESNVLHSNENINTNDKVQGDISTETIVIESESNTVNTSERTRTPKRGPLGIEHIMGLFSGENRPSAIKIVALDVQIKENIDSYNRIKDYIPENESDTDRLCKASILNKCLEERKHLTKIRDDYWDSLPESYKDEGNNNMTYLENKISTLRGEVKK